VTHTLSRHGCDKRTLWSPGRESCKSGCIRGISSAAQNRLTCRGAALMECNRYSQMGFQA
jgi:hypothetical protein